MKRRTRVIQISGFKGLLAALFVISCLAAGFIAFPSIVAMHLWNYIAGFAAIPAINIWQGAMLWAIVAISGFILNDRNKYLTSFSSNKKLDEEQIKKILDNVKLKSQINNMILKSEIKSMDEKETSEKNKEKENV